MATKSKSRKANGQFKKGHTAITHQPKTITKTKKVYVQAKRKPGRRRRGGAHSNLNIPALVGAGAVLGWLTGDAKADSMSTKAREQVMKIPGAKTIGADGMIGVLALGVNHFFWRNRYLKALGLVGVAVGAMHVVQRVSAGGEVYIGDDDDDREGFVADVED